ncbi:RNA polymerase sigma factor [Costertonia aggregata]|uniref:RNA polymerase sigma factor n=1 Tax=Costertonia aggregata TaxID=343403 RepID=A0A7H9AL94_9FLAO|nr:RNA polymerase sigma factor [Costertonia aggregata]QLG44133.1 RNA polymerase sigma factor [Costertonia aggregata]
MNDTNKIFDGLLVLQYRSGDRRAMGLLVRKYHKRLCNHAFFYTNDIHASKDIVQDCWGVIINKLNGLRNPNLFGSWAFKIVIHKSLDYVEKQKKELNRLHEYHKSKITGDSAKDNKDNLTKLYSMIKTLPKEQQIVLRLFYTENYTLKEIADILKISIGTVKSRLFYAREKLKSIVKYK